MARRKTGRMFTEAAGNTVESIAYAENPDWQELVVTFTDGKVFSFEFSARVTVRASYLKVRKGDLDIIRNYGPVSGGLGEVD